jgi:hypothetical protein
MSNCICYYYDTNWDEPPAAEQNPLCPEHPAPHFFDDESWQELRETIDKMLDHSDPYNDFRKEHNVHPSTLVLSFMEFWRKYAGSV